MKKFNKMIFCALMVVVLLSSSLSLVYADNISYGAYKIISCDQGKIFFERDKEAVGTTLTISANATKYYGNYTGKVRLGLLYKDTSNNSKYKIVDIDCNNKSGILANNIDIYPGSEYSIIAYTKSINTGAMVKVSIGVVESD